jgi:hypothetical protein
MSKKSTSSATLTCLDAACPRKEFRLNNLPLIDEFVKQLLSKYHARFKYFHAKSHFHNTRKKPKDNFGRITKTMTFHGGNQNAC